MEELTRSSRQEEMEIDLLELFHVLLRKVWLILICLVAGAVIVGGYTRFLITPQYSASATIYILSNTTSITSVADLQIGTELTGDFAEIARTRSVVNAVIDEVGLDESYEGLLSRLSTTNPSGTHLLKLTATDPDPQRAADIANAYAQVMASQIADIMNTDEPNIAEEAVKPSAPASPNLLKNTALGGLAGAFLACLVIFIQFMMNDTIQTEEDVRKYLDINTLAAMPLEKRRRKS
ncbi:YveK family protein [Lachnoclostridium sp. An118]|uniref:YveK family protein n=1 Tax=Lachnoclostridium sp. An118 TaxID=1965547 RepID=UPI000B38627D|nr:Wzz/FepE/Etk N-terminal domain-containing protein [Lachnoclostridium sp. An118]OUQ47257.1 polysaccharide export protein [Lachnoclostridium sp. An118]